MKVTYQHIMMIENMLEECKIVLETAHIKFGYVRSISFMSRKGNKYYGMCYRDSKGTFDITINPVLMIEGVTKDAIKNVVMHELIHTVKDCFNHGTVFHNVAELVRPFGYIVDTYATEEVMCGTDRSVIAKQMKYTLQCTSCNIVGWKSRINDIKYYEKTHWCRKCHGRIKVTKNY